MHLPFQLIHLIRVFRSQHTKGLGVFDTPISLSHGSPKSLFFFVLFVNFVVN